MWKSNARLVSRAGLVKECIAPQAGRLDGRTEPSQYLDSRKPHDVLLIEPVELLGIEDGVAAADAVK